MNGIEQRLRSWEPRPVSNRLRNRLFGRNAVREQEGLQVPLAWCWMVPMLTLVLWIDAGPVARSAAEPFGLGEHQLSFHLVSSNGWIPVDLVVRPLSAPGWAGGTFASTNLAVSPSTNPPLSQVSPFFMFR
jgi:hypothetical protein